MTKPSSSATYSFNKQARWRLRSLFCFGLGAFLTTASHRVHATDIGFFYALDRDFDILSAAADRRAEPSKIGLRTISRLNFKSHRVYAVKMESGAVASALSADALLAKFPCDLAIALGPAGALSDDPSIGQWFRVTKVLAYQHGVQSGTGFSLSPNSTLDLPFLQKTTFILPKLFQAVPEWTVASGEVFVVSAEFRQRLQESTRAEAVEMNLFGLASACRDRQTPLFCWRIISDHADEKAGEDFKKFVASYDGAGAKALVEMIRSLPANPNAPESYSTLQKLLSK